MNTHILVEGESEAVLLEQLLADLKSSHTYRITCVGGRDAVRPLARKFLLQYGEPTALVLDADTSDRDRVRQQQRDLDDYLGWAARDVPYTIQQFVPEMEVIFFDRRSALKRILGHDIPETTMLAGKRAPKEILADLLKERNVSDRKGLMSSLSIPILRDLRQHPIVKQLRDFTEEFGANRPLVHKRAN